MPASLGPSARRASNATALPMSPSPLPRSMSAMSQYRGVGGDLASPAAKQESAQSRNVRVVLRIRPSDPDDVSVPPRFRNTAVQPISATDVQVDADPAVLTGHAVGSSGSGKRQQLYSYDHVLGEESSQVDTYNATAADVVDEFLAGHNVTFLAYGQTSSGKSYSMGTTGEDTDYSGSSFTPRTGLIPRTVQTILQRAEEARLTSGTGASWECRLSFLELYNEEIIDLLSGAGVQVTIREERDRRIVWAGVREVKVRTLAEVMGYLQEGATHRKTGETDMNATSSRSHAIFSLTLVQRRRRSSPSASAASPDRHSLSPDHGSSTVKRTPSLVALFAGSPASTPISPRGPPPSSFGLQPPPRSSLPRPNSMTFGKEKEAGEMMVITSKFNMVDLAGSERLKRTGAQGERMKEGISINGGLSALGNVISTLCDPVKSKGHVPYRDSKLTRMLQDSIGGNALTTMIACVSPIEYNVVETINTLKYAQRARAIRNAATVNAVEAGWDDVEHLQSLVLQTRKQVADLGVAKESGRAATELQHMTSRLSDLQREHTELHDRYLHKCSENMRLAKEIKAGQSADPESLANFSETVEPVILEYEKVVSALNRQLEELRTQIDEMSLIVDTQSAELAAERQVTATREVQMTELQLRVGKLSERNQTSESYIIDLEAKLKSHGDTSDAQSTTITALRREVSDLRSSNAEARQHTLDVESRLEFSEKKSASLAAQISKLENDAERREKAYNDLEKHMTAFDFSVDRKKLVAEIEERDMTIIELQAAQSKLQDSAAAKRARTPTMQSDNSAPQVSVSGAPISRGDSSPDLSSAQLGSSAGIDEPQHRSHNSESAELGRKVDLLTARCAEAEDLITSLTAQLAHARSASTESRPLTPATQAAISENGEESDMTTTVYDTPPSSSIASASGISPQRRRKSTPLSSSTTTLTQPKPSSGSDFRGGRGLGGLRPSPTGRPRLSLSQELSSAQSSAGSPGRMTGTSLDGLPRTPIQRADSLHAAASPRTAASFEKELRYVHGILNERETDLRAREAYIEELERRLSYPHNQQPHTAPSLRRDSATTVVAADVPLPPSPSAPTASYSPISMDDAEHHRQPTVTQRSGPAAQLRLERLEREVVEKEASHRAMIDQQFRQIAELQKVNVMLKESLYGSLPESAALSRMQSRQSLNPLSTPESPATSTSASSDIDSDRLKRDHAEEMEQLAMAHAELAKQMQADHAAEVSALQSRLNAAEVAHSEELHGLRESHGQARLVADADRERLVAAIDAVGVEHAQLLERLQDEHEAAKIALHQAHAQTVAAMQQDMDIVTEDLMTQMETVDEERRKLKLKHDQMVFEVSRMRDQTQLEKNQVARQMAELQKAHNSLVEEKIKLESRVASQAEEVSDDNHRHSRKPSAVPPQGPPPTGPLPPLPMSPTMPLPALPLSPPYTVRSLSSGTLMSKLETTSRRDSELPYRTSNDSCTASSRDGHLAEDNGTDGKLKHIELELLGEQTRALNLSKELADARRANSKLKTHLEDVRDELKRQNDACKGHSDELAERRQAMASLTEETTHSRDSLLAANAQVATLKAQLDKAVDEKVNKKLASRLKCF